MGQPEGQVQYFTREQVTAALSNAAVPSLSGLTDISFNSADNSINSLTTDFVAAGYASGMLIMISGSVQNNNNFLVWSVTSNKMIVEESSVAPEIAGATIAIAGTSILRANQGNVREAKLGERCYICTICNQSFPESKMQYFRGRWYCIPNGDFKDIASILKVEWARGYKPSGLGEERIVPPIIKG
jgi:hypothetical protein